MKYTFNNAGGFGQFIRFARGENTGDPFQNGNQERKTREKKNYTPKARIFLIIVYILWLLISYYVMLPPMNIHSVECWNYLAICVILPGTCLLGIQSVSNYLRGGRDKTALKKPVKYGFGIVIAMIVLVFIIQLYGAEIFHASEYASILQPTDYEFTEDIDQASAITKIALMDTSSAIKLGNREIGTLSELVSQYNVSEDYAQIDLNGSPVKVTALDYAGFFKYWANKDRGIPGYVSVDPVGQSAKYNELSSGMKYVPSAYFFDNLDRHLRLQFPTKIFGNTHFEVDEEGNPYYVASVYGYKIGLFSGQTVIGAIVCNPVTGESSYYDLADVPTWVDCVFSGELLVTQYNWNGNLSNGFINSKFAKKGVKRATETKNDANENTPDYGYISKDGDIWIYTGVTSVNDDASNIGFILVNQRTGEAHYYTIAGADENSAMSAAEGEVQEKRYTASFPSLVNVDEQPTYVMVLKDASGIVKLYAMVNVQQYNIVTTASTLDACFAQYRKLIGTGDGSLINSTDNTDKNNSSDNNDKNTADDTANKEVITASFVINSIQYIGISGDTYVYLEGSDGKIYRQKFADNETLISLRAGDTVNVSCTKKNETTFDIRTISK